MTSAASDLTARARIRDAALERFGADGVAGTSVRAVAADAGVSPGLVLHHFGSKDGLRRACDEHVVTLVRDKMLRFDEASLGGGTPGPGVLAEMCAAGGAVVAYLGRAVADGGHDADVLVDELVDISEAALDRFAAAGVVTPAADPRARAALLVLFDLAVLVLGRHLQRTADLDVRTPAGMQRWSRAALELYTHGLFRDESMLDTFDQAFPPAGAAATQRARAGREEGRR